MIISVQNGEPHIVPDGIMDGTVAVVTMEGGQIITLVQVPDGTTEEDFRDASDRICQPIYLSRMDQFQFYQMVVDQLRAVSALRSNGLT